MRNMTKAAIATWMRSHREELAEFDMPATERTTTMLNMDVRMTKNGIKHVDPFEGVEDMSDVWKCVEVPEVTETFDFL